MLQRLLLCLALLVSGTNASADPELHVVGVYHGPRSMMTNKVSREVKVTLDRPGVDVVLVLSSYTGVDWEATTTEGTPAPSLVLSQIGPDDAVSTILLNGSLVADPRRVTLPLTYRPEGDDFRDLVGMVPDLFGVDRMSSFSGSYDAPEEPFVIDRLVADERYDVDYLRRKLVAGRLPDGLRRLLPPAGDSLVAPAILTYEGFVLTEADGRTRTISPDPKLPEISWPVAAVRDAEAGMIYGFTFGGDGLIYAYDEARDSWRILRSMEGLDATGMILDPGRKRLLLPMVRFAKPGALVGHDLSGPDTAPLAVIAEFADLPGLTDLYDPGNGPGPALVPAGLEGDLLLLISTGPMLSRPDPAFGPKRWRAYVVDLTTGAVDFVGYEGGIADR